MEIENHYLATMTVVADSGGKGSWRIDKEQDVDIIWEYLPTKHSLITMTKQWYFYGGVKCRHQHDQVIQVNITSDRMGGPCVPSDEMC